MHTIDTVYCAAITPMNYDQSVDLAGLVRNIRWYREQGLAGVLVCGGTGEFVSLSFEERQAVVAAAAREIAGSCGFMAGCAAETTREAILHAQHAEVCGADGLLLIAPYYFKPSREELLAHMRAVARSVSIPVVLYNNPGSCGSDLTPDMIRELSAEPNIASVKEATGELTRVDEIRRLCPADFHVMCGCDYLACDIFEKGGSGWISITANALPGQSQKLFDLMMAGDKVGARAIMEKYLPLYTLCEQPYKAIQTIKFMMEALGCASGPSRLPRQPLTEQEQANTLVMMRQAGLPV